MMGHPLPTRISLTVKPVKEDVKQKSHVPMFPSPILDAIQKSFFRVQKHIGSSPMDMECFQAHSTPS